MRRTAVPVPSRFPEGEHVRGQDGLGPSQLGPLRVQAGRPDVNENGVINDEHYEYDSISRPFFENLGWAPARRLLAPDDDTK
jgi:hypothetical protein